MDFKELLEYLDLEDASQFEYFESMADLLESEDYIEREAMYQLFDGADKTMIAELLDDYFEDMLEGLPEENSGEIFSLLHQIKLCLVGMASQFSAASQTEEEEMLRRFTDQFYRFQSWYSHESEVILTPEDGGQPFGHHVRDAITACRLERLGGEKYAYDFENALDYELDSYSMSFADLMEQEGEMESSIVFSPEDEPGGGYDA